MTTKLIVGITIGVILLITAVISYLIIKKRKQTSFQTRNGFKQYFLSCVPLIFFIAGLFVLLFGIF